jgi:hypothetical protein
VVLAVLARQVALDPATSKHASTKSRQPYSRLPSRIVPWLSSGTKASSICCSVARSRGRLAQRRDQLVIVRDRALEIGQRCLERLHFGLRRRALGEGTIVLAAQHQPFVGETLAARPARARDVEALDVALDAADAVAELHLALQQVEPRLRGRLIGAAQRGATPMPASQPQVDGRPE